MTPDVSVVVVTYNSASAVGPLLDSIPAGLDGLSAEVVVVDNSSTDDTRSVVAARSDCHLVVARNRGYAAGVNAGVAASRGSGPILVLNPDAACLPGSIRRMVERASVMRSIVAPRIVDDDGTVSRSLRRRPTLLRTLGLSFSHAAALTEIVMADDAYSEAGYHDWATGAALLVPRACHEAVGGWDESYFMYSEETDFCLRASDLGWRTFYDPGATIRHSGRGSGWNPQLYVMQTLNRVRIYRRRAGPILGAVYYGLVVLREAAWAARGNRDSRHALRALLAPRARPRELGQMRGLVPR